jgi:hypothetical protein
LLLLLFPKGHLLLESEQLLLDSSAKFIVQVQIYAVLSQLLNLLKLVDDNLKLSGPSGEGEWWLLLLFLFGRRLFIFFTFIVGVFWFWIFSNGVFL